MGEGHIPIPRHPHYVLFRLHIQQTFKNRHQIRNRNRRSVAEIINPQLCSTPLLAFTTGALLRRVDSTKTAFDDIVNISEIPTHLLIVHFENGDGLALEDVLSEGEISHVWATPRPINSEEPEPRYGKTVDMVVRVSDLLAGFFGRSVEASGLVGAVVLGEGVLGVETIHRAGRSPHYGGLGVSRFGNLEKVDETGDVGVDVRLGVNHGVAHAGLGSEVEDVCEGDNVEELCEEGRVVEIGFDDEDGVGIEEGLASAFQGWIVVGIEVVETQHAVASFLEGEGSVCAHEARSAGDENGEATDTAGC